MLIVALIIVFALSRSNHTITGPEPTPASSLPAPQSAAAAVQGYLDALASGDAPAALAYAATPPANNRLLTAKVLRSALQSAPLSDIHVESTPDSGDHATVQASYRLGDEAVTTTIPVTRIGSRWLLAQVAATIKTATLPRVAFSLGGVPIDLDDITLFPGSYTLASDNPLYELDDATLVVTSPTERPLLDEQADIELTPEGTKAVRSAAEKLLASCLKQKSLEPSGCGFHVSAPHSGRVIASSISWKVTRGVHAIEQLEPDVYPDDPSSVSAETAVRVRSTFRTADGNTWVADSGIDWVDARITGTTVEVTFE